MASGPNRRSRESSVPMAHTTISIPRQHDRATPTSRRKPCLFTFFIRRRGIFIASYGYESFLILLALQIESASTERLIMYHVIPALHRKLFKVVVSRYLASSYYLSECQGCPSGFAGKPSGSRIPQELGYPSVHRQSRTAFQMDGPSRVPPFLSSQSASIFDS